MTPATTKKDDDRDETEEPKQEAKQTTRRRADADDDDTTAPPTIPSMIGGEEVIAVADAKDADTFRNPVVLAGPTSPDDPGQQLVTVREDAIREFKYPGTQRVSRQLVMAAGTMTTRRLAEEAGIKNYDPVK